MIEELQKEFEKEITRLKNEIMDLANKYGNVIKFKFNVDYQWADDISIIDWKEEKMRDKKEMGQ